YVGTDISPEALAAATADHRNAEFVLSDGVSLPFAPETFDLVHASGVLHMNAHYHRVLESMWRQTKRFLLCDLRLTRGASEVGRVDAPFGQANTWLPYVVLNVEEAVARMSALCPAPRRIVAKGYGHAPGPGTVLAASRVIMAFFLVEKGAGAQSIDI